MEQGYPRFMVYREDEQTQEERERERIQSAILEKLDKNGFGIKIEEDFYMGMPCMLLDNNYPLEIYKFVNNTPTLIQTFYSWDEIEKFANSIN